MFHCNRLQLHQQCRRLAWSREKEFQGNSCAEAGGACESAGHELRARAEIFTFWRERRAGRCEAPRRSRCRTSSRSGNKADARPPPRPFGLRPAGTLALLLAPHIRPGYCSSLAPCQRAWGPAAKCEFISARALKAAERRKFFAFLCVLASLW